MLRSFNVEYMKSHLNLNSKFFFFYSVILALLISLHNFLKIIHSPHASTSVFFLHFCVIDHLFKPCFLGIIDGFRKVFRVKLVQDPPDKILVKRVLLLVHERQGLFEIG